MPEADCHESRAACYRLNVHLAIKKFCQMTFHINRYPTIQEVFELAALAKNTPVEERVCGIHLIDFRLAEDRQRSAFMFQTSAISRDSGLQNHYLLYFMRHWFDIRSRDHYSSKVSFYDFPPDLEVDRKWIEQCFGQAARIHGLLNGGDRDAAIFDPIFCEDNWYPG